MTANQVVLLALMLHFHFAAPAEHAYASADFDVVKANITYDDPPEYMFPQEGQWDLYDTKGNYWMGLDTWRVHLPLPKSIGK